MVVTDGRQRQVLGDINHVHRRIAIANALRKTIESIVARGMPPAAAVSA
jgi:hypothetical protein